MKLWQNPQCVKRMAVILREVSVTRNDPISTALMLDQRAEALVRVDPMWREFLRAAEFYLREIEFENESDRAEVHYDGRRECGRLLVTDERCTRCERHQGDHGVWEANGKSFRLRIEMAK